MNELRWILLGLGIALVGVIYLFSRRRSDTTDVDVVDGMRFEPKLNIDSLQPSDSDTGEDPALARVPPSMVPDPVTDTKSLDQDTNPPKAKAPEAEGALAEHAPVVAEKVIALHLVPKGSEKFSGIEFVGALQAEGLKFGRFDIFHRFVDPENTDPDGEFLFSVANLVKPGTISLHHLEEQEFKGASMFLVLPGPSDAVAAFADMVATGRRLAATLSGQLLDGHGTQLSRQRASHLREDIINHQHGISPSEPVA